MRSASGEPKFPFRVDVPVVRRLIPIQGSHGDDIESASYKVFNNGEIL
jgi:hypothetical protein